MTKEEQKLIAWYKKILGRVHPRFIERFVDDAGVYPDSVARELAMMGIVPIESIRRVEKRLILARQLCDKWGEVRERK